MTDRRPTIRTRTRAGAALVHGLAVPLTMLLAFTVGLLGFGIVSVSSATPEITHRTSGPDSAWKASYSKTFPGCVASVLWPVDRVPAAVVVLLADGEVARISRQAASHGALQHDRYEDARIIGACYQH